MDMEAEIRDLKRRMSEVEGSFGFFSGQLRDVHRDLLGFRAQTDERFDKVDGRLERVDGSLDRVEGRLGRVEQKVDELPRALAEVIRSEFDRRDRDV